MVRFTATYQPLLTTPFFIDTHQDTADAREALKTLRQKHTAEACRPHHLDVIRDLLHRTSEPPLPLQEKPRISLAETLPQLLEGLVQEINRQFHASIFICGVWRNDSGELVTTQSVKAQDELQGTTVSECVSQHFAQYVAEGSVMSKLPADLALPVSYPDFAMQARPALPPVHPDWVQERENLIQWLRYLWQWQGGKGEPAWGTIVQDINARSYRTIDMHRLPYDHLPFHDPLTWGEDLTREYSVFFRSCTDDRGRVCEAMTSHAFQFRTVCDTQGIMVDEALAFRTTIHPNSSLYWDTSALLYEKRVLQIAFDAVSGAVSHGEGYYAGAAARVERAQRLVPQIRSLWLDLKIWEDTDIPEAPTPSVEELTSWHPAALHVLNDPSIFSNDHDSYSFPITWRSCLETGHAQWSTAALRTWLKRKPFLQGDPATLLIGRHGICVTFYTILHYILNVADHMPTTDDERDLLIDQYLEVYGPRDVRTLARCTEHLATQLAEAPHPKPPPAPTEPADHLRRTAGWKPTGWLTFHADGARTVHNVEALRGDFWNVFRGSLNDFPLVLGISPQDVRAVLDMPILNEQAAMQWDSAGSQRANDEPMAEYNWQDVNSALGFSSFTNTDDNALAFLANTSSSAWVPGSDPIPSADEYEDAPQSMCTTSRETRLTLFQQKHPDAGYHSGQEA
ncbi:hypothetical protein FRC08_018528 [Ceratobasidium sp. 394]|nr:hypothetical protein FRC08_018528 [Ceratobasidium sp. 394]